MADAVEYLRSFNLLSVLLRLLLAAAAGGMVGYGRAKKQRNAGLRTYMLVSLGAALTMLISIYENQMLQTQWNWLYAVADVKFDSSRYAAQVISGIGFLAAGTILAVAHQQVSGLTSAIGLIAAGAIGIAAGAGFYEIVLIGAVILIICMEWLQPVEVDFKRRIHNITVYVELDSIGDLAAVTDTVQKLGAKIYDIDVENSERTAKRLPSAIIIMKMAKNHSSHSAMLSTLAELDCVQGVRELIS